MLWSQDELNDSHHKRIIVILLFLYNDSAT